MKGLLLVGGKSSRMGTDKSEMIFRDGLTQRERGAKMLGEICDEVFISVADGEGENIIADAFGNIGPLGAIASAQQHSPDDTWLVLACDLPLLEPETLEALQSAHQSDHNATYFNSATDGFPEPLCTIWGPSSRSAVSNAIASGKLCPRSVLQEINGHALDSPAYGHSLTPTPKLMPLRSAHS